MGLKGLVALGGFGCCLVRPATFCLLLGASGLESNGGSA